MKKVASPAFNIGGSDVACYVTVLNAKDIKEVSTVSRVSDDPKHGYQRLLSDKRAHDIRDYLEAGNIIPGSIILSAQDASTVTFDETRGELSVSEQDGKLFVIDGQHRLYGASLCDRPIQLPVCIFVGLSHKEEVQYFLDINSNQKGVPKTLRIELLKFLSEPDSKDALRNKLFNELSEDVNSPLYGKTSPTVSSPGKISHVPFQNAIDPIIEGGVLRNFDFEGKKHVCINYLSAVERILIDIEGNPRRLTSSAFFQAVFKVFEDVCNMSLTYYKNYREESFYKVLEGLSKIDFSRHGGSNQQAINELSSEMKDLLDIHSTMLGSPEDLLY